MCECGGMYHRCISGWVGDGKISVLCVGGTWYQCPGVEVVLRSQESCLGKGVVVGGDFMSFLLRVGRFQGPSIKRSIE